MAGRYAPDDLSALANYIRRVSPHGVVDFAERKLISYQLRHYPSPPPPMYSSKSASRGRTSSSRPRTCESTRWKRRSHRRGTAGREPSRSRRRARPGGEPPRVRTATTAPTAGRGPRRRPPVPGTSGIGPRPPPARRRRITAWCPTIPARPPPTTPRRVCSSASVASRSRARGTGIRGTTTAATSSSRTAGGTSRSTMTTTTTKAAAAASRRNRRGGPPRATGGADRRRSGSCRSGEGGGARAVPSPRRQDDRRGSVEAAGDQGCRSRRRPYHRSDHSAGAAGDGVVSPRWQRCFAPSDEGPRGEESPGGVGNEREGEREPRQEVVRRDWRAFRLAVKEAICVWGGGLL